MKKGLLLVMALMFTFVTMAFAATVPADKLSIDLKTAWNVEGKQKAVFFNHEQHSQNLKCESCHSTPEGNSKMKPEAKIEGNTDKNGAHQLCWTCHKKQEKDPVKKVCTKCHTGKAK